VYKGEGAVKYAHAHSCRKRSYHSPSLSLSVSRALPLSPFLSLVLSLSLPFCLSCSPSLSLSVSHALSLSPFLSLVLSLSLPSPPLPSPRLSPPASLPLRTHKRSSGPSFAREIATGLATAVVVASHSDAFANQVTSVHCNTLHHTATHCNAVQHAGKSARQTTDVVVAKALRWVCLSAYVSGWCTVVHHTAR